MDDQHCEHSDIDYEIFVVSSVKYEDIIPVESCDNYECFTENFDMIGLNEISVESAIKDEIPENYNIIADCDSSAFEYESTIAGFQVPEEIVVESIVKCEIPDDAWFDDKITIDSIKSEISDDSFDVLDAEFSLQSSIKCEMPTPSFDDCNEAFADDSDENNDKVITTSSTECAITAGSVCKLEEAKTHKSFDQNITSTKTTSTITSQATTAGIKSYSCNVCFETFKIKGHLNRHLLIHTGAGRVQCDVCKKSFSRKGDLRMHIEHFHLSSPFKCYKCPNKSFTELKDLKSHRKSFHKQPKVYSCDICSKQLSSKYSLQCHRTVHTGETPFICEECGKVFHWSGDLKRHIKGIHSGVKAQKFECEICKKSYSRLDELKRHSWNHTEEKPFKCDLCDRTFTRRDGLKYHLKTCSNSTGPVQRTLKPKKNKCEICGNYYAYSNYLKVHMRIHTGEKPYKCGTCTFSCVQRNQLSYHIKKCSHLI